MTITKKTMAPETDFPIMKMSLNMIIMDCNAAAIPIIQLWGCRINSSMPLKMLKKYPQIMEAASKNCECYMNVQYKDLMIRFTIMPFPEAGYIGFYGYEVERCNKPLEMFQALN